MKRTLKRELKVPETAEREANRVYCPFACIACCGLRSTVRCVAVESESVPSPRSGSGDKGRNPVRGIRITLPGRVVVGTEVSTTCNQVRCAGFGVIGGKFAGIRIVAEARVAINLRCSGLWHNGAIRPVWKHGPRSLTCVRVFG